MKPKEMAMLLVAVTLIAVVLIIFFIWKKQSEDLPPDDSDFIPPTPDPNTPNPDPDDTDPYVPPGMMIIPLDKKVSGKKEIKFYFDNEYFAQSALGSVRMGGSVYTNCRIKVHHRGGSWDHLATISGWPGGFTSFAFPINARIDGIKFVAEQGVVPWIGDRYIDHVRGQVYIEV